jgi:hypothetical protein
VKYACNKGKYGKSQGTPTALPLMMVCTLCYRKLTAACHTKASNKNNTGITGKTSTKGSKGAYASGKRRSNDIDVYI